MQLSVSDVAKLLSVSEKTVYRWIQQGRLPAYRLGQQLRFNKSELLEWATAQRVPLSPDLFAEPEAEAVSTLCEALRAGGVLYRVGGANKRAVLEAAVDAMRLPDDVDRDVLLAVLLARERLGSTGIGDGIAIPHVRNPIVLRLTKPSVTLCFLERPVDFDAIDGVPVHALFVVTAPSIQSHLHMLSRLAWMLRDDALRQALVEQPTRDRIFELFETAEATLDASERAP